MPSNAASRTARDLQDAGVQTSVTAITTTLSTLASITLATAAGAASVPVAGWVVAAVAIILTALTTLVEKLLTAKIRRTEAVQWAREMNLPDPEQMPGFIVDVHLMGFADRYALAAELTRQIKAERDPKKRDGLEKKRGIVAIILTRTWLAENAARLGRPSPVPPAAGAVVLRVEYGTSNPWLPWLVGGMLVATAGVVLFG